MSQVLLATLALVDKTLAPGAADFSHHSVTLSKDGVPGDAVSTSDDSITFTDLEPGTYVVSGLSVDTAGQPMTDTFSSGSVVIPADAPPPPPPPTVAKVLGSITLAFAPPADPVVTDPAAPAAV